MSEGNLYLYYLETDMSMTGNRLPRCFRELPSKIRLRVESTQNNNKKDFTLLLLPLTNDPKLKREGGGIMDDLIQQLQLHFNSIEEDNVSAMHLQEVRN